MSTDENILNALTSQKNVLLNRINLASDAEGLERVGLEIGLVANLWIALGYEYKLQEVRRRLVDRAACLHTCELAYILGCRKNDKTIHSSKRNLARLEEIKNS